MSASYGIAPQRQGEWDPFQPLPEDVASEERERQELERRANLAFLASIFNSPHARAWLRQMIAAETERATSWRPGLCRETQAWHCARLALLQDIQRDLEQAMEA